MKRTIWVLAAAAVLQQAFGASLLVNPGMEDDDGGGGASNWWTYGAAGRVDWANRNPQWGTWGNAFFSAGNAWGGFGQDVAVDTNRGNVFQFAISGKAEANYTNDNTTIAIEFWNGGSHVYTITRNVYGELDARRGEWAYVTLTHTNTAAGVTTVKVRCDYADGTIPGGAALATCQWDDGRFFQTEERPASVPRRAKFEPLSGAYLGVLLERGGTAAQVGEFNQKAGRRHAVYAKFLIFKQDPFPWDWAGMILSNHPGAALHFILEPMVDFEDFYAPDWGPGQATYEAALDFVTNCAHAGAPVFLRFAHEANGDWYPWHPRFSERYGIPDTVTTETYIEGYRNFARLVHSNAPNIAMVWAPNQGNGPDPLPYYGDVYPGDEYVDWVGLSVYNGRSYGNSNNVLDYQFRNAIQRGYWQENDDAYDDTFEDFYWTFSDPDNPYGHHKPMMIAETAAAFEPHYAVSNEVLLAGFESLDGPDFTSSNTLAQFQSLNSDGFEASGHTWVEGFESLSTWDWGPWGTNGFTWTASPDAVEGTNALVMSGDPEAGGVYIGGNGRSIGSVPFDSAHVIAQFQDLDSDGLVTSNEVWIDAFEVPSLWNWGAWGSMYWSNTVNLFQGTNAVVIGASNAFSGAYVGGNGRDSFASGSEIPVNLVSEFQGLYTNDAGCKGQDWWPEGTDCVPWGDADDAHGGWHAWAATNDPYGDYPTNALVMSGTDANTNGYIGGNGCDLSGADRDWSEATSIRLVARRANDLRGHPVLKIELNDGGDRTASISRVVSEPAYTWSLLAITNASADSGFDWADVRRLKLHLLAETNGADTGDLYVKRLSLTHLSVGADLTAFDGMVIWVKRAGAIATDPLLRIELRSPLGTAGVSRVVTGTEYYPLKIPFDEMEVSPGFSWANVGEGYVISLLTTVDDTAPDPVYLDKWYACRLGEAPWKDQDWGALGPAHDPWGDVDDANGGWHAWELVTDEAAGYPPRALKLSGADLNTNHYVGGNLFFTRPEDRDWSVGTHLGLVSRVGGQPGAAEPMLRIELLDGASRTAAVTEVVTTPAYSRLLIARAGMAADTGFEWTNVVQVKLHLLTAEAGVDPDDVYLKEWALGDVANETPSDWSSFNGMELWVKRGTGSAVLPLLGISVRSASDAETASVQRVVTGTEYYPLRILFDDLTVTPAFQWTNISSLVFEMLTEAAGETPADLHVDRWQLVNLAEAAYRDQDWWPPGTNDLPWGDETDADGGWIAWDIVNDPLAGFPDNALRMSGHDANTNYYIGGNGFALRDGDRNWGSLTYLSLLARRGDMTNAEPLLLISLVDGTGVQTAQTAQVIVPTNYLSLQVPFGDMTAPAEFQWTNVSFVIFELLSGTPGMRPSDVYLKQFQAGTASNEYEQDWWTAGTGYQPWGDSSWTQTTDAAAGVYALQISGVVTGSAQWYIGGNGCSLAIPRQDWSSSGALALFAKKGDVAGRVQPKFKITLDNDYAETNGNEAVVETKVANTEWYEMVIAFEDFIADPGFAWTNVRMLKIEYFTGEGGKQPNDLFLDDLRRVSVTLTNGADNLKWKRDWCNQLYALENFEDADPDNPDYASIFEHFRNLHMINWFHVKKFEDGFTKDLKIAEDGTNGVVYGSYYDRIKEPYFLTNIVTDSTGAGVSDAWIIEHFGSLPGFDPADDPDDDRMNNHDEYVAGTDPNDDDSVLDLAPSVVTGSGQKGYVITWPSEAYRTYALEVATNLVSGSWTQVARVQATPPENSYTHYPEGESPHFYRVRLAP